MKIKQRQTKKDPTILIEKLSNQGQKQYASIVMNEREALKDYNTKVFNTIF